MKKHLVLTVLLSAVSGLVVAEPAKSILVQGSPDRDFGVACRINGKVTFSVNKNSNNHDYQVARNIYLTDVGAGKVAITMLRGFVTADKNSTYVMAADESCETFSQ